MLFVSYNIQYGRGKDDRFDLERIAREINGADVIALQEVERHWQRSGDVDQVATLSTLLPEYFWVYGAGVDLHAGGERANGPQTVARRRQFGNLLMSRTPIHYTRNHLLPKFASATDMSLQRSALEGVIQTERHTVRCYSVHLTHLSAATRLPQVDRLLALHDTAVREGAPVTGNHRNWFKDAPPVQAPRQAIILGDFNAEPDSCEYARLVGPRSDYGARIINPERFVDAWVHTGHAENEGFTSDVNGRPARLDYCFVSAELAPLIRCARIDEQAMGSDHRPVWTEIAL